MAESGWMRAVSKILDEHVEGWAIAGLLVIPTLAVFLIVARYGWSALALAWALASAWGLVTRRAWQGDHP